MLVTVKNPFPITLGALFAQINADNVKAGWWTNPITGAAMIGHDITGARIITRDPLNMIALMHTEIWEASRAARNHEKDDHLPHLWGEEVEMADALIRAGDLAGGWELPIPEFFSIDLEAEDFGDFEWFHNQLAATTEAMRKKRLPEATEALSKFVFGIIHWCDISEDYAMDLVAAVTEKRAYNAQRADHKLENRQKEGGKVW